MCDFSKYGFPSEEWLRVEATLPAAKDQSLSELKVAANEGREAVARIAMPEFSGQIITQNHSIPARDGYKLEARSYRPISASPTEKLPIYMHFHGGGFLFGTLSSEDAICSRLAVSTKVVVVNVNYRHTPEYTYPTAWNDAEDSFLWVCEHIASLNGDPDRIIVGGISAGAWLAASLTLAASRSELPASPLLRICGQVLMIPALVYTKCYGSQLHQIKDPKLSSYSQNENAPILNMRRKQMFNSLLKVEDPDPSDKRLNPGLLSSDDTKRLPPTTLGIAGYDPLRDEGLLYGKLLAENRVPTNVNVFKGMPHGFRRFGDRLSVCKQWDQTMEDGIRWALAKPAAPGEFIIQEH
ncbi:Alpha/beta hydrolase fold-3 [Penicillium cf. griseofulvum]|nr:Alpha/beta hydrolase fold-3 [Penicillium cf. griseofulvum]